MLVQYSLYGHCGRGDKETEEGIVGGRKKDKERVTMQETVSLGVAFTRWREQKVTKGVQSDAELALFLLD